MNTDNNEYITVESADPAPAESETKTYDFNSYADAQPVQPKKKSNTWVVILIVLLVILCCCIVVVGGGLVWWYNYGQYEYDVVLKTLPIISLI